MKTHPPKLKTTPRPLFSCGLFRHCTQTVLSPTTTSSSNPPPFPPVLSHPPPPLSSSSSSSSNTSQSFTQWKFPLLTSSPIFPHDFHQPPPQHHDLTSINFQRLFHAVETQLMNSHSDTDRINALHILELMPNPPATGDGGDAAVCPAVVMENVVGYLKDGVGAKPAMKVLLALCIMEGNRRVAVEAGAAGRVVEALAELEGAAAERALAALELMCTLSEGAADVRAHALAVPMMVEVMGKMDGRGKEYAISVLAVVYGGGFGEEEEEEGVLAPPEEVARAVELALQGDCSARGRRKGAQLLKMLRESEGLDLAQEGGLSG